MSDEKNRVERIPDAQGLSRFATTYMPPFLDQSTNHCVEEVYAPVGDMVGLADVGFNARNIQ
jgi:hypothetical protein